MKDLKKTGMILILISFMTISGCKEASVPSVVVFESLVQTGGASGSAATTGLILTFNADPVSLTERDITVTGATKGILSGTGTTRLLTISAITVDDRDTVCVAIANPAGYLITEPEKSTGVYIKITIGMAYKGGIVGYVLQPEDPGYVSGKAQGLIAATEDQSSSIQWIDGNSTQTTVNGKTSTAIGTGSTNTIEMVNQPGSAGGAAVICQNYTNTDTGTGVYSDWYLPSKDELVKLVGNKAAIGGFSDAGYWSSSEVDYQISHYVHFQFNGPFTDYKNYWKRVRAIRAF